MVQFDIEEPKNEASDAQDSPSVVTRCLTDNFNVDKRARLSMVSRQYDSMATESSMKRNKLLGILISQVEAS